MFQRRGKGVVQPHVHHENFPLETFLGGEETARNYLFSLDLFAPSCDGPRVSLQPALLQASSAQGSLNPSAVWKAKPLGFLEGYKSTVPLTGDLNSVSLLWQDSISLAAPCVSGGRAGVRPAPAACALVSSARP
ncbi:uncharacterized protein LOC128918891 isoform X2 [Rissa tridactyla]|uniref:uncharacterized protein LOC128918891 isoform X2 n=1 Tax=Rissa tridactyla TaxID=75485 RepID=UPI0023BAF93A|nr:uncharacterized protein LOC128918891 isoform X2 [Rissa tridactyla]